MALGLAYGRNRMEDYDRCSWAMGIADEACDSFKRRLGEEFGFTEMLESTICRDIQTRIYGC